MIGTLLFRTDASTSTGLGHAMRCIALGQEWRRRGGQVVFAMAEWTAGLSDRLQNERFERLDVETGAEELATVAMDAHASFVVLDVGPTVVEYSDAFSSTKVAVIDDAGTDFTSSPDLIVNQNAHAHEALYPGTEPSTLLLGLSFVALRAEFLRVEPTPKLPPVCQDILLAMGGTDPMNLLAPLTRELLAELDVTVHVVISSRHRDATSLGRIAGAQPRLVLHVDETDLASTMSMADLALTSGGTTVWELAYMGVPSLVGSVSPLEERLVEGLDRIELFRILGSLGDTAAHGAVAAVGEACQDLEWRQKSSKQAMQLVDGRGTERVVTRILELSE